MENLMNFKKLYASLAWLIFALFFGLFSVAHAQTDNDPQNLKALSRSYQDKFAFQKTQALARAEALGLPIRKDMGHGRVKELMRFRDGFPVYYSTRNREGAGLINTDKVWPQGGADLDLTGEGMIIGVWDAGKTLASHQEFQGRVTQMDDASVLDDHATHVAGTIAASGVKYDARGMSYNAQLNVFDWDNDLGEMAGAAAGGLLTSNHSYGESRGWEYDEEEEEWFWYGDVRVSETEDYLFGFYYEETHDFDELAYNAQHYLIVRAAGNDRDGDHDGGHYYYDFDEEGFVYSYDYRQPNGAKGGYDTIPADATGKNVLTVGAVDIWKEMSEFSNWGPTDDGRVKPDIVAKGVEVYSTLADDDYSYDSWDGTSMAAPMVTGSIGLLLQHQNDLYGQDKPFLSSTMKNLVIHGADDSISKSPGPDYRFGWGLMDTLRSAGIMGRDVRAGGGLHIYELTLEDSQELSTPVIAKGSVPLRASIVWTDPPGTPPEPSLNPTDLMLINDLDLRVFDSLGNPVKPYFLDPEDPSSPALTGDNFRDNVEMVHIESPVSNETYTIKVSHKGELEGGSQLFSLIVTGNLYSHTLYPGWNLMAVPVLLASGQPEHVFGSDLDNVESLWVWESPGWKVSLPSMDPDQAALYIKSKGFGSLEGLETGQGFWTNSKNQFQLAFPGEYPDYAIPQVASGWNLMGITQDEQQTIVQIVDDLDQDVDSLWKWSTKTKSWQVSLPGDDDGGAAYAGSKGFGLMQKVGPGEGFWVNVD